MSHRENIQTTIHQIIEYWFKDKANIEINESEIKKYTCCW